MALGLSATEARAAVGATCTSAGGVASVQGNGVATTIGLSAGVPTVNGTKCGLTPVTLITVAGASKVIISAAVPASMSLELATAMLTMDGTAGADFWTCPTATSIDRNHDGTADITFVGAAPVKQAWNGLGGDDHLECRAAGSKMTLAGGDGDDYLEGGPLVDALNGNAGADLLIGGAGNDTFTEAAGDDVAFGGDGNDKFKTGAAVDGHDTYAGEAGKDTVDYAKRGGGVFASSDPMGTSEDAIGDDIETINGGMGDDVFDFSSSTVMLTLIGNAGADWIAGGFGKDKLYGGHGEDVIYGGGGDDWLHGDDDADVLDGGAGKDIYDAGGGDDQIADTFDGVKETVNCSLGTDSYFPNAEDVFSACEVPAI